MRNLNKSDYKALASTQAPHNARTAASTLVVPSVELRLRKRIPEEKIRAILDEYEQGARVPELCWKYGITDRSFYRWKAKFGVKNYEKAIGA